MASHATRYRDRRRARDEAIVESLVIPFPVIVLDEFVQRVTEVSLPQRNHPVETFFFDRPDKALGVGIRVRRTRWRQCDANARIGESASYRRAPLPIPIADQHAMPGQQAIVRRRRHPSHLAHEQLGRMGCGPQHMDAA